MGLPTILRLTHTSHSIGSVCLSDLVCKPSIIIYPSVHPQLITRIGFAMNLQGFVYVISIIMKIIFEPWMPLGSSVDFALPHSFSTSFWRLRISKSICKSAGELVDWLDESPWKSPYLQHKNAQHRSVMIMISKPYDQFRPWSNLWSSSNWFKHPVIQSPETCRG